MLRFTSLLTVFLLIACATTTWAQDTTYVPDHNRITGTELVAVYLGAQSCGPCHDPDLKQALSRMKLLLDKQARERDWTFSAMGVALDWEVTTGYEFLKENGQWDEANVGKNWTNLGASQFLWADTTADPAIPQIVLLQREVDPQSNRIALSDYRVLARYVGPKTITEWVNEGASVQSDQ